MFWLGIQGANGAQCITIMITAIWPSYGNIKDHIGMEKQGISTQGMIRCVSHIKLIVGCPLTNSQLLFILDYPIASPIDSSYSP